MIAVDINVLVRIITGDNTEQASLAAGLLNRQKNVFISKTVLLELEWVLRSAYKIDASAILRDLTEFLERPNVEVEDEDSVRYALNWYGQGMDFADALHLGSAGRGREFLTFDGAMLKLARRLGLKVGAIT